MLSDTACKNAHKNEKTSTNKPFKLTDEKGLYLLMQPQVLPGTLRTRSARPNPLPAVLSNWRGNVVLRAESLPED